MYSCILYTEIYLIVTLQRNLNIYILLIFVRRWTIIITIFIYTLVNSEFNRNNVENSHVYYEHFNITERTKHIRYESSSDNLCLYSYTK